LYVHGHALRYGKERFEVLPTACSIAGV